MSVLTFTLLESKLFFRNAVKAFSSLAIPVILLLLMGGINGNIPDVKGYGMVDYSIPGYMGIVIAFTGLMSLPVSVAQYRERKILKRFKATPTHAIDLLISQVLVNMIITIIGFLLLLVTGKLVYQIRITAEIVQLIFALLVATISIFTVGFVIASFCGDVKTANAVSFLLYFPMLMLSGATIPINAMPPAMAGIAKLFPLTYGIDLIKDAWLGEGLLNHPLDLIVLVTIILLGSIISVKIFRWE